MYNVNIKGHYQVCFYMPKQVSNNYSLFQIHLQKTSFLVRKLEQKWRSIPYRAFQFLLSSHSLPWKPSVTVSPFFLTACRVQTTAMLNLLTANKAIRTVLEVMLHSQVTLLCEKLTLITTTLLRIGELGFTISWQ